MAAKKTDDVLTLTEALAEFKRQMASTVRADDEQTHHDLAVRYEELGLLQEALDEYKLVLAARQAKAKAKAK